MHMRWLMGLPTRRSARRRRPAAAIVLVLFLVGLSADPAAAQNVFQIDQRFGSIEFSVDHLGLFTSHGDFRRFAGTLAIDPARPERTTIAVTIDAQSVDMDSPDGLRMVRSPDYFDVGDHPVITFHSTGVMVSAPDHYRIDGTIEIRGVARPMSLDAVLASRATGSANPFSEFVVSGSLKRGEFGMVADQNFVSETVQVQIRARIALDRPAPGTNGGGANGRNAG
jgi:polyisoprenoid-binding protein YceI